MSSKLLATMNIIISVIPHSAQRYDTVGDWHWTRAGNLRIHVSQMSDRRYEILVAAHELVEAVLCREDHVSEKAVDAFDMAYERNRRPGDVSEPGDHAAAPYHEQHKAASQFERALARLLGVDWDEYNKEVESK